MVYCLHLADLYGKLGEKNRGLILATDSDQPAEVTPNGGFVKSCPQMPFIQVWELYYPKFRCLVLVWFVRVQSYYQTSVTSVFRLSMLYKNDDPKFAKKDLKWGKKTIN